LKEIDTGPGQLDVVIGPCARAPAFVTVILEVLVRTLHPVLKSQWFLADVSRMINDLALSLSRFCLDPACPISSIGRTRCLASIVRTTAPLRRVPEYRLSLGNLPERFLQIRLECGLKLDWEAVDHSLIEAFSNEKDLPVSRALIRAVAAKLEANDWTPSEKVSKLLKCLLVY